MKLGDANANWSFKDNSSFTLGGLTVYAETNQWGTNQKRAR